MSTAGTSYRTAAVPVRGGDLAVGVWGPDDAPTVLAIHGITASHRAWALLGSLAPELRIIAPDLRGRGRSNSLSGPWGMPAHAGDAAAVLDAFGIERCVVLGHSMGGFVAATLAARHPSRVSDVVLIDGGLPIPTPDGVSPEDLPEALIGSAARRLALRFPSMADYRDFWRGHPAFAGSWTPMVEQYVDYDLQGTAPDLAPSAVVEAVAADAVQLAGDEGYAAALAGIRVPLHFIRAPRNLSNELPGLYTEQTVAEWGERLPQLRIHEIDGVNHYTIVMSEHGMRGVLRIVRPVIAAAVRMQMSRPLAPPVPQPTPTRERAL